MRTLLAAIFTTAALATTSEAQVVNNYGLTIQGGGSFAGRSCNTPSCQLDRTQMAAGTAVQITVWGTPNTLYALAVSAAGGTCLTIPGINGGLLLSSPIDTISVGTLNTPAGPSICLALQQSATIQATIPTSIPGGTVLRLQALTNGGVGSNSGLVFTNAIDLGVL